MSKTLTDDDRFWNCEVIAAPMASQVLGSEGLRDDLFAGYLIGRECPVVAGHNETRVRTDNGYHFDR